MDINDSDYVVIFNIEITSISKTIKKLWIQSYLHQFYIQTIYNDKEENTNYIFSTHVEPLLDNINHTELVQELKINLYAAAYKKT